MSHKQASAHAECSFPSDMVVVLVFVQNGEPNNMQILSMHTVLGAPCVVVVVCPSERTRDAINRILWIDMRAR